MRVEPVGGGAEADHDRHVERERALHLVRDERRDDVADFRWIDGLILIDLFAQASQRNSMRPRISSASSTE